MSAGTAGQTKPQVCARDRVLLVCPLNTPEELGSWMCQTQEKQDAVTGNMRTVIRRKEEDERQEYRAQQGRQVGGLKISRRS